MCFDEFFQYFFSSEIDRYLKIDNIIIFQIWVDFNVKSPRSHDFEICSLFINNMIGVSLVMHGLKLFSTYPM